MQGYFLSLLLFYWRSSNTQSCISTWRQWLSKVKNQNQFSIKLYITILTATFSSFFLIISSVSLSPIKMQRPRQYTRSQVKQTCFCFFLHKISCKYLESAKEITFAVSLQPRRWWWRKFWSWRGVERARRENPGAWDCDHETGPF